MLLRLRAAESRADADGWPKSSSGLPKLRGSRVAIHARGKLDALRETVRARYPRSKASTLAKILIREMRHGMSEGLMLEAIAKMAARPVAGSPPREYARRRCRTASFVSCDRRSSMLSGIRSMKCRRRVRTLWTKNEGVEVSASVLPRRRPPLPAQVSRNSTPMRPLKADGWRNPRPNVAESVQDAWGSNRTRTQDRWCARPDSLQRSWPCGSIRVRLKRNYAEPARGRRARPASALAPTRSSTVRFIAIDGRRKAACVSGSDAPVRAHAGYRAASAWSSRCNSLCSI